MGNGIGWLTTTDAAFILAARLFEDCRTRYDSFLVTKRPLTKSTYRLAGPKEPSAITLLRIGLFVCATAHREQKPKNCKDSRPQMLAPLGKLSAGLKGRMLIGSIHKPFFQAAIDRELQHNFVSTVPHRANRVH